MPPTATCTPTIRCAFRCRPIHGRRRRTPPWRTTGSCKRGSGRRASSLCSPATTRPTTGSPSTPYRNSDLTRAASPSSPRPHRCRAQGVPRRRHPRHPLQPFGPELARRHARHGRATGETRGRSRLARAVQRRRRNDRRDGRGAAAPAHADGVRSSRAPAAADRHRSFIAQDRSRADRQGSHLGESLGRLFEQ